MDHPEGIANNEADVYWNFSMCLTFPLAHNAFCKVGLQEVEPGVQWTQLSNEVQEFQQGPPINGPASSPVATCSLRDLRTLAAWMHKSGLWLANWNLLVPGLFGGWDLPSSPAPHCCLDFACCNGLVLILFPRPLPWKIPYQHDRSDPPASRKIPSSTKTLTSFTKTSLAPRPKPFKVLSTSFKIDGGYERRNNPYSRTNKYSQEGC